MKQKWRKLGLIFCPTGDKPWLQSHAAVPFAAPVKGSIHRIYFSSRDLKNRSFTSWFDVDLKNPKKIMKLAKQPLLAPGDWGEFDDSGAQGSCLVQTKNGILFYYFGWNLGVTVPFRNSIGLAKLENGKCCRAFNGPILDRTKEEPQFCSNPFVILQNKKFRMWYISCIGWRKEKEKEKVMARYHIKYAESKDGIHWTRKGKVAIDFRDRDECAISRPCVIFERSIWKMWYSYRGRVSYRIGYAESKDGIKWNRRDNDVQLKPSAEGWDSEMVEYPFVFDCEGDRYMLYNGNGFGKTGVGLAILEQE